MSLLLMLRREHTSKISAICTKHGVVLALKNGRVRSWTYSRPIGSTNLQPRFGGAFFGSNGKHPSAVVGQRAHPSSGSAKARNALNGGDVPNAA